MVFPQARSSFSGRSSVPEIYRACDTVLDRDRREGRDRQLLPGRSWGDCRGMGGVFTGNLVNDDMFADMFTIADMFARQCNVFTGRHGDDIFTRR